MSIAGVSLAGAQASSPFELIPRLEPEQRRAALGSDVDSVSDGGVGANPFDIVREGGPGAGAPAVRRPSTLSEVRRERLPGVVGGAKRQTFDAVLALGLLLLYAITLFLQRGVLRRMLDAAFNANRLERLLREQQRQGFFLWAFLGSLSVAAYAYASVRHLHPEWLDGRWTALDGFMLAVLALTLAKLGALEVLKAAFPLDGPLGRYQLLILVWLAGGGLLAFPLLVLVSFGPAPLATVLARALLPLVAAALLLRSLAAVSAAGGIALRYPLHFLLYLCALEIGPLLVLYRAVSRGLSPGTI